jgi:hypothetical protein
MNHLETVTLATLRCVGTMLLLHNAVAANRHCRAIIISDVSLRRFAFERTARRAEMLFCNRIALIDDLLVTDCVADDVTDCVADAVADDIGRTASRSHSGCRLYSCSSQWALLSVAARRTFPNGSTMLAA